APLELDLPFHLDAPTLAVGGHMKNTLALAWGNRAVVSPHIGDLDAPRARRVFDRVAADLQQLYSVAAERVVADLHPDYASSRWARDSGLPVTRVQHHRAHASALYAEHAGRGDWLVFAWDGVGLGDDGGLWGGEAFAGSPGAWRRVAALRPFRLPGGERAARQPWRAALGLCWEAGDDWEGAPEGTELLRQAWERGHQCPTTSAAGRLFDGAAALLGLAREASFEGQGPMLLEAAARGRSDAPELPFATDGEGLDRWDWGPLLPLLRDGERPVAERAAAFHHALARAILTCARRRREAEGIGEVGLTGGVFQNRLLTETARELLAADGFRVHLATRVPCNDGGLAFGQVAETT
ncbi:MAG TPA: carbamoyltransferase HypF, partial [Gammaproteobacteria bacterium]|nr:carbamoyltransferase HypF [Gammaproteobacteria bacterium]